MWLANHLVLTCYVHGYGKFNNCPTPKYIALCHYTWRWLLASDSKVWMRRLCLLIVDNTDYFGCDYKLCYSTCVEGFTLWNVVIGGFRWSDIERPCAQLCTMSSSQCGWLNGPLFSRGSNWPTMYVVWASFKNCHYVDLWKCFQSWHMGCLMPRMEKMLVGKWFCPCSTQ